MIRHPLYPKGNIYLSGGMQHAQELGVGWRDICSVRLKELGYFPINIAALDIAYTEANGELYRYIKDEELFQRKSNIRKHFVDTDVSIVRNDTDAVIILYDDSVRKGAGTTCEIHEAFMADIPVFLLNTYGEMLAVPGWMQAETTKIFNQWDDLYEYMSALPDKILRRDVYGNHRSGSQYLCSLCGEVEMKHKSHFVSKISPLYCKSCVEIVKATHESHADRYSFIIEYLEQEATTEILTLQGN